MRLVGSEAAEKTQLFNLLFSGLRISFDWKGKDVDFLANLKSLRRLTVEGVRTINISVIDKCRGITSIVLECKIPKKMRQLELSHLEKLKLYLGPDFIQPRSLYQNNAIKRIHIYKYQGSDLRDWNTRNLEHLTIDDPPDLTNLNGIHGLKNLKLVEINNCKNFKSSALHKNEYPYLRVYIDGVSNPHFS